MGLDLAPCGAGCPSKRPATSHAKSYGKRLHQQDEIFENALSRRAGLQALSLHSVKFFAQNRVKFFSKKRLQL